MMYVQFPPPGLPIDDGLWVLVLIAVVNADRIMNVKNKKNVSQKK